MLPYPYLEGFSPVLGIKNPSPPQYEIYSAEINYQQKFLAANKNMVGFSPHKSPSWADLVPGAYWENPLLLSFISINWILTY